MKRSPLRRRTRGAPRAALLALLCAAAFAGAAPLCAPAPAGGAPHSAVPTATTRPAGLSPDPLLLLSIQQAQLTAGDGAANDSFGSSVAVSGDTALVGAPGDDVGANANQGSACVFVRAGGIWTQQQILTASDGAANDAFGFSVALSGDTALVGARYDEVGANTDQGSAYVFVRAGGIWTQQQTLTAADGASSDYFGTSVALSGDTALVGAPYDDGPTTNQGSVCVFVRSGGAWSQQQKLTAGDGAANDHFGASVALSGDTALVGAPDKAVGGNTDQGSAYVFLRSGGTWVQQQKLTASDGATEDGFGFSVALSGDTALVGASWHDVGANTDQGSAYAYVRAGGTWTLQQTLTPSDGAQGDYFGTSVALSGDVALVGARNDAVSANTNQGSACVFLRSGAIWNEQQKLTASDGTFSDYLGTSVALSGGTALVGAPYDDVGAAANQGSAYAFTLDLPSPSTTVTLTPAANAAGWNRAAVTLGLSATAAAVVDKTYYRLGSSGSFSLYSDAAKPVVTAEGTTVVEYYSTDLAGNAESVKSVTVKIDTTAPATSIPNAAPGGWSKSAVTVVFSPSDALSGMSGGAARTEYFTDGGATWTTGTSATVSAQGSITLQYRSVDAAGNVEAAKSAVVKIDGGEPTTRAYAATVRKGRKVKLAYKVADALPGSGQATVTLKIYKGKKLKKTIAVPGPVACNLKTTQSWKCTLPKGRYTLKVYATDLAGNVQRKVGAAKLVVR
jgi:hypothetical protein